MSDYDLDLVRSLASSPPVAEGFYPLTRLPSGMNLNQPRGHGLDRIDKPYTPRNLAAMSHLWRAIHCVVDDELAGHLAFVFTSLYQRVTRLSEFRFWGGSGNTPRFNVPFIFNEANVFITFKRKARTIQDHLETTGTHLKGRTVVVNGSASNLAYLPDRSIDLVFTDPPFGANINYSEMNIVWEAWLGRFTETRDEAIVNRYQNKGISEYQTLMTASLRECRRVLRPRHPLLLMFMNSSKAVWEALRSALEDAGFEVRRADVFDKQHGTFKHFVSPNTAGCDLVLHCHERSGKRRVRVDAGERSRRRESVKAFLKERDVAKYQSVFLHIDRETEIDVRRLYSEWIGRQVARHDVAMDFAEFRQLVQEWGRTGGGMAQTDARKRAGGRRKPGKREKLRELS